MNDQYPALYASFRWHVPAHVNIAHLCIQRWASNPMQGRKPVIFSHNEFGEARRCSYGELADTTGKLAAGLRKMGVLPSDRVVISMAQGPELVAACMAVLAAGAVVVPLSPVLNAQQVTARVIDAQAKVAIVDAANVPGIVHAQSVYPALAQIIGYGFKHEATLSWSSLLARQPAAFNIADTTAQSPAFLFYPLGADAPLKGVVLPHSVLIGLLPGFVASQNWFPQANDVFWTQAHWSSPEGLLEGLLPCLYFGHPILVLPGTDTVHRTLETLAHYKVSNVCVPWSSLRAVMADIPDLDATALAIRAISATGEHAALPVAEWFESRFNLIPNAIWGRTEATAVIGHSARWPGQAGSLGRAFPGHLVSVIDPDGRICPAGVTGEIAVNRFDIHGFPDPVLFSGYWHNPELTHEHFNRDWFLTGTLAHIDPDGYFWFDGHTTAAHDHPGNPGSTQTST
ncbi:MAG: AMP-binding protein [Pusillimonas sp.]